VVEVVVVEGVVVEGVVVVEVDDAVIECGAVFG